jgi:hypothetical protein
MGAGSQLERNVEGPVCRWADARGIVHIKLNLWGRRAWPDREFFIKGGRPALVELKRRGKRPRRLQAHVIGILKELGYDVCYADNTGEAVAFLEKCVAKAMEASKGAAKGRAARARAGRGGDLRRPRGGEDQRLPGRP